MAEKQDPEDERATAEERRDPARDRRAGRERRAAGERRKEESPVGADRRSGRDRRRAGPEGERRKVERRINEYVLEADVLEFINALNDYKTRQQRPFPTWSEVFKVFLSLGYKRSRE